MIEREKNKDRKEEQKEWEQNSPCAQLWKEMREEKQEPFPFEARIDEILRRRKNGGMKKKIHY